MTVQHSHRSGKLWRMWAQQWLASRCPPSSAWRRCRLLRQRTPTCPADAFDRVTSTSLDDTLAYVMQVTHSCTTPAALLACAQMEEESQVCGARPCVTLTAHVDASCEVGALARTATVHRRLRGPVDLRTGDPLRGRIHDRSAWPTGPSAQVTMSDICYLSPTELGARLRGVQSMTALRLKRYAPLAPRRPSRSNHFTSCFISAQVHECAT